MMKKVKFHGTSKEKLRAFPFDARQDAGYQLDKVQRGEFPDDWKPFSAIGSGVKEIRIYGDGDAFRVIYVANFDDAIHVLHAFQKKTRKTRKSDINIAKSRYRKLVNRR